MPSYEVELEVRPEHSMLNPATIEFKVLGNYIVKVMFVFPDGSARKTRVALYHGIRQLYPFPLGQWFAGNNETISFNTLDRLPGEVSYLRLVGWNDGGRFPHVVALRLFTMFEYEMRERIAMMEMVEKLTLLLRRIGVY